VFLTLSERLSILSILPTKGDFVTLKVLNKLKMGLAPSEKEIKEWGINQDIENKLVHWEKNVEAEIPVGEVATGIIVDSLRDLDKSKTLPIELFEIYEKFIPTTE